MAKKVRLEDIAQEAGVSIATVSRALSDNPAVSDKTKRRIWDLARRQGYNIRSQLGSGANVANRLSVIIPKPQGRNGWMLDPFFQGLLGGIGEAARSLRCDYVVSHADPQNYDDLSRLLDNSRASGIIFLGQSFLHERLNRLVGHPMKFIVWGGQLPDQSYASVGSDNLRGGEMAAAHLARLGRTRIAFFGDTDAPEINQRYQGYRRALERFGISPDPDLVFPAHFEIESAANSTHALISRGTAFDAVVCASDLIAIGVIRALREQGRSVPQDVSVVGYDDIQLARYIEPPLTTIGQDLTLAGRLLVMKLLNADEPGDLRSERLPTELIQRESCGALA
ncbi:LacI family DNA-binding transcriptional regulator [Algimonas porphyrae]|uniref:LacI family transcriptional regulator n=1 Tax=Algimonas porphyrae TaxID=1128113 RepID=A0ABQ5V3V4_9PROT|nr:LacI family DNA-binding transcriptional regulator [Algimonas porphyrae]GLQ21760.1 LacI family transcriptional regulator [Algimonas porphyrae]